MFNITKQECVAIIQLKNPPVNAVRFSDWAVLPAMIEKLESDPDIAAIVFTGMPGKHFCGGNDVKQFNDLTPQKTSQGTAAVRDAMKAVYNSPLPCIAALHGAAMGSGFMLASACDVRIATPDASLALPEIKVEAFGGYSLISQFIPKGEARWMTYTGRPISGARAYQIGAVQQLVTDAEQLLPAAISLAGEIGKLVSGRLNRRIKPVLNQLDRTDLWDAYDIERLLAVDTMGGVKVG